MPEKGQIIGYLVNSVTRAPIARADVTVDNASEYSETNSSGGFGLPLSASEPNGTDYYVRANQTGYHEVSGWVHVWPGKTTNLGTIPMVPV